MNKRLILIILLSSLSACEWRNKPTQLFEVQSNITGIEHTGIWLPVSSPIPATSERMFILTIGKLSADKQKITIESQIQGAIVYEMQPAANLNGNWKLIITTNSWTTITCPRNTMNYKETDWYKDRLAVIESRKVKGNDPKVKRRDYMRAKSNGTSPEHLAEANKRAERARSYAAKFPEQISSGDEEFQTTEWQLDNLSFHLTRWNGTSETQMNKGVTSTQEETSSTSA